MVINKGIMTIAIIIGLSLVEAYHKNDLTLVYISIFFLLTIVELMNIKQMIKNIKPWY